MSLRLHADFQFELFDLILQAAEPDAIPEQVDEDDGECEEREEKGDAHIGGHAETALRFGV
jgi:hypothetical protein